MKTKGQILLTSLLMVVASMCSLNLSAKTKCNKPLLYKDSGDTIRVGDLVKISTDNERYETKERIIHWAFDSIHTIRQVNSKYHPNAVLLKRIYSWIPADAAIFVARADTLHRPSRQRKIVRYDTIARIDTIMHRIDTIIRIDTVSINKIPCYDTICTYDTIWKYDTITIVKPCPPCPPSPDPREGIGEADQINRFSIALRGGFASTMAQPSTFQSLPLGFDARIDFQYAHYWRTEKKHLIGLILGASAGYMNVDRHQMWDEIYTLQTSDLGTPVDIQYHVTADDVHENMQQWQVEVPLMFSMIAENGLYFNVGPRFLLPLHTPIRQVITNGNIWVKDLGTNAEMPQGNAIYGELNDDQLTLEGVSEKKYSWTVTLGFELGYEFELKPGYAIGLGAYANFGLYNANYGLYSFNSSKAVNSVVGITPPVDGKVAVVKVNAMSDSYTSMMGHLDAGIKLSFNFDFPQNKPSK